MNIPQEKVKYQYYKTINGWIITVGTKRVGEEYWVTFIFCRPADRFQRAISRDLVARNFDQPDKTFIFELKELEFIHPAQFCRNLLKEFVWSQYNKFLPTKLKKELQIWPQIDSLHAPHYSYDVI